MNPAAFDYEVAESVDHALELLRTKEDAKLLAGGHSLLPLMKLRLARPGTLVDIGRLSNLRGVTRRGRPPRHRRAHAPPRPQQRRHGQAALPADQPTRPGLVGDPQVRHRGTIGGSLAHGDPASDLPTVCLALDAVIVVQGAGGERTIDAKDFFQGFFETALGEDEIITEIRVPKVGNAGWSYLKFHQRSLDWATVGVAAVVGTSNGTIQGARIGLTNMGQTPLRASATEAALAGAPRDGVKAAAEKADEGTDPPGDTWATPDFRRHLARVLTERAVEEALAR